MKKLLIGAATALALTAGAATAFEHGQRHDPQKRMQHMLHHVDATDAQRSQIKQIVEANRPTRKEHRQALREIRRQLQALDSQSPDYLAQVDALAQRKGQLVAAMTVARAASRQQIGAVLTVEQRAELKQRQEERRERRAERRQRWHADQG